MATTNFYLKAPDSTGKSLIQSYFRFTENKEKKQVVISTSESINPKHWDKNSQRVKRSVTGYSEINNNLDMMEEDVKEIYRKLLNEKPRKEITPEIIKDHLNQKYGKVEKPKTYSLVTFGEFVMESASKSKSPNTLKGYKTTLNHLKDFEGKKPLLFEDITLDFYQKFKTFLTEEKKLSPNTVGGYFKNIKVFLNEATERGLNKSLDFKSKKFKVDNEEAETIYLTKSEIQNLYELDLTETPRLERVRDLFIVGCYTGLRFSDFSQIAPENIKNGKFHIRTQKTDEPVIIPIHPMVSEIMEKYKDKYDNSLPPSISNQKMNGYLKEIGKKAGLLERINITKYRGAQRITETFYKYDLISTHTARRSFATNLYLSDFPAISIMKITGHRTEKAFMKYIKVTQEQNADKLEQHWSGKKQNLKKVV
jgi:integrase